MRRPPSVDRAAMVLAAKFQELADQEARIDLRLAKCPPWSERWWYTLGQLNIVRRARIALHAIPRIG